MSNSAFVFIKPHAVTDQTIKLVRDHFVNRGLTVDSEGKIDAKTIESKQLIDNHYYAIASKATLLKPSELNIPKDKFESKFGLSWDDALSQGKCFNALDAAAKLGLSASELDQLWAKTKKAGKLIKFGGGFYCGEVEPGMYVFNGFFMSMREKYVKEGASIYYFTVTWPESKYSWADFRSEVLGATDPNDAPPTSIRNIILKLWKDLGLEDQPNVGDNGVHASASPLEAFCERRNWLGVQTKDDVFGSVLASVGYSEETLENYAKDPQVTPLGGHEKGSLWDYLEDRDTSEVLGMMLPGQVIGSANGSAGFCPKSAAVGALIGAIGAWYMFSKD
jgi:nucleoside diphosphate kinase